MLKNVYCNYGSPFNVLVCVYSSTAVKPANKYTKLAVSTQIGVCEEEKDVLVGVSRSCS
jgi:hypothetical protein